MKKLVILLLALAMFVVTGCAQETPTETSSVEPLAQTEHETPILISVESVKSEEVFFGDLGGYLWPLDDGTFLSYTLGYYDSPGPGQYPLYTFPLVIRKCVDGGDVSFLEPIPDPYLEVGAEWETIIRDIPQGIACKVRLIRVNEEYKYIIKFFVSPDGGKEWFSPTTYPPS